MTNSSTQDLLPVLHQVAAGLAQPTNHYMLLAHWYDYEGGRVLFPAVYLHLDAAWNVELLADVVAVDVLLDRSKPEQRWRITIPYAEIYGVKYYAGENFTGTFTDRHSIYFNDETMASLASRLPELLKTRS